ncbi:MAG: ABC transporter permease [Planctomycetes bacterium]|nr:ABC transporter permease [Planctomycetota bacterium]
MRRFVTFSLFVAIVLALWEAVGAAGAWPEILLPRPSRVLSYLGGAISDGSLLEATLVTGKRLFAGYALGFAFGLPLGLLTAHATLARDTIGLVALGLQTLPSVCWVPLALLWFGQTETAMLFVVIMGTIWSILLAAESGVRNLPPIYTRAARTMGSRRLHLVMHVVIPAAFPAVVAGLKQGWAFAWRSLMAAEIFVTILTGFGLGHLLHYGRELHAMDQVLGVIAVIVAMGLLTEQLVFAPLEHWLKRRWGLAN